MKSSIFLESYFVIVISYSKYPVITLIPMYSILISSRVLIGVEPASNDFGNTVTLYNIFLNLMFLAFPVEFDSSRAVSIHLSFNAFM